MQFSLGYVPFLELGTKLYFVHEMYLKEFFSALVVGKTSSRKNQDRIEVLYLSGLGVLKFVLFFCLGKINRKLLGKSAINIIGNRAPNICAENTENMKGEKIKTKTASNPPSFRHAEESIESKMSIWCALPSGKIPSPGLYLLLSSLREAIPDFHFPLSNLSKADFQIVPTMNLRVVKWSLFFFSIYWSSPKSSNWRCSIESLQMSWGRPLFTEDIKNSQ